MRSTPSTHRKRTGRKLAAVLLTLAVSSLATGADDTALFSTSFPPNVLLMVDNSGSMNEIMMHPAFDGSFAPTCSIVPTSGSGSITDQNGKSTPYVCSSNCRLEINAGNVSDEVLTPSTTDDPGTGYVVRKFCGETRKLYFDGNMTTLGNTTRWVKDYTDWYFSIDTDNDSATYGTPAKNADTIVAEVEDPANGTHYIDGTTFALYQRARMTAAKEVARDVIYQVNSDCPAYLGDCGVYSDNVRFGLATFRSGSHGGFVTVPIDTYGPVGSNPGNRIALNNGITALDPGSNTPLGETLFQLYTYFMSRSTTTTTRPLAANSTTLRWPAYAVNTSGNVGTVPPDPVTQNCQKNFIIILTDGAPTADNFSTSGATSGEIPGFSSFSTYVGDYNPDSPGDLDIGSDSTPEVGSPPWEVSDGAGYLDDIAKFMQVTDMRPDKTGVQKVDVYTIGFATDALANSLLAKTAAAGNGLYASSGQAQELTDALVAAIEDIIVKAQAFTAATVPASRATDGNNFFASYFKPDNTKPYWEGHLKLFEYNAKGEVLDKPVPPATLGVCALEDPLAPAQCQVGRLKIELDGYWDAANEIPSALESGTGIRNLLVSTYTSAPPSTIPATPTTFNSANMTAALLNITETSTALTTLITSYAIAGATSGITTAENLADAITRYIRGCAFSSSTTCTDRGDGKKLWDIFHSNPIVVGPPNSGLRELAYKEFADRYAHRKRVIYAGSNGGFLHGFNTGTWDTSLDPDNYNRGDGAEVFGFMNYAARKKIREVPKTISPKVVTMDGSPSAGDVWFYPTATSLAGDATTWASWHTVLIAGMREGGRVVSALDVTNPSGISGGPIYPGYLWEFPCESTTSAQCTGSGLSLPGSRTLANYMGDTWSEPVITRVKVRVDCNDNPPSTICPRYDRWVAIFGGGYDPNGDPNLAHTTTSTTTSTTQYDNSNSSTTSREGRALFMVDIKTGKVLGMKRYDNTTTGGVPDMRFAFAATPAVIDLDFDGYADLVYAADLGGNLWKWVITADVRDPINGTGDVQHNSTNDMWPFVKLFSAASCQLLDGCLTPHYRTFFFPPTAAMVGQSLWLALGSGERNNLQFIGTDPDQRNRFYAFKDADPLERELSGSTSTARYTDAGTSTNFVDADTLTGTCNPPPSPAVGFYVSGIDGEKFITDTTIFFGKVLTSSYIPTVSSDPCEIGGQAYLYGFELQCGQGIFPEDPSDPGTPQRVISIGAGMPNRPRVSVGPVSADRDGDGDVDAADYGKVDTDGDGDIDDDDKPPCRDMAVVITSEGSANMQCPGGRPDSGVNTKSWRQN